MIFLFDKKHGVPTLQHDMPCLAFLTLLKMRRKKNKTKKTKTIKTNNKKSNGKRQKCICSVLMKRVTTDINRACLPESD